jgi:hypothetical protein
MSKLGELISTASSGNNPHFVSAKLSKKSFRIVIYSGSFIPLTQYLSVGELKLVIRQAVVSSYI